MITEIINIVSDYLKEKCSLEQIDHEIKYVSNTESDLFHIVDGLTYWIEGTPHIKIECLVFTKENTLIILNNAKLSKGGDT